MWLYNLYLKCVFIFLVFYKRHCILNFFFFLHHFNLQKNFCYKFIRFNHWFNCLKNALIYEKNSRWSLVFSNPIIVKKKASHTVSVINKKKSHSSLKYLKKKTITKKKFLQKIMHIKFINTTCLWYYINGKI